MATINLVVGAGADNGHWDNRVAGFSFTANPTPMDVGNRFSVVEWSNWYRFTSVTVDQAATISSATLTFQAATTDSSTLTASFWGNNVDNASAPTTSAQAKGLAKTTASTAFSGSWTNNTDYSFDVTTIVQEIVNRAGWANGNAIQIMIIAPSSNAGTRAVKSYANSTTLCPRLSITTGAAPSAGGHTGLTLLRVG